MSVVLITAAITVGVLVCAAVAWHFWIRRAHRGAHARHDEAYSVANLITDTELERPDDVASHREFLARARRPVDMADSDTRLVSGEHKALLCGEYGGAEPLPDWPTELIA